MPLESCMILLDNSEYMRNGDYIPTRMEAQNDAANLLVGQKTQSNPESTVGVIAMSGGSGSTGSTVGAELLVSPTDDMGKILSALHGIPVRGGHGDVGGVASSKPVVDVPASVQVASLALKHRRNKNGAQRIVLFVGSPLANVETRTLTRAGKQLKKNNVAIDVVAMGELEENEPKLKELVDAANGSGGEGGERTCHLVTIPPGVLPSDVLVGSPIVNAGGAGGGAAAASAGMDVGGGGGGGDMGSAFAEFGGVDPNMDPELAMALRVSMEEERARQERAAAAAEASAAEEGKEESKDGEGMDVDEGGTPAADSKPSAEEEKTSDAAAETGAEEMGDEDALLQQALAMSMGDSGSAAPEEAEDEKKPAAGDAMEEDDEDEDAAMQLALQMSMNPSEEPSSAAASGEAKAEGQQQQEFQDPQFVNQLLGSLPGVDPNDPGIQNALKTLNADDKEKKDDSKKDEEDKK
mmetsp:Transcript_5377/g.7383  ORF Transcript_5377/g.7383 Transcript_5377/m.7383 type:complete len:466 (-) Transcript_5377:216-1613(-)|eukprot:CAMPEP_0185729046 /NCGR_PEP_ID=MMETSP1171-20130828/4435_1 /TAXON_ID=374046 /ORGANISM="Helicotheca tamensis, Strain CCMP826" /LENGTH=465 /DNA_ID=CAMNT_0028397811 /DNA_START=88 /DNA_END=1485 /DNA_ORIENTATION=+